MPGVANTAFRSTFGVMFLAALVACGSEGEAGPYGEGGFPGLGFVGSGGRGSGYGSDAGGNGDGSAEGGSGGRDGGDDPAVPRQKARDARTRIDGHLSIQPGRPEGRSAPRNEAPVKRWAPFPPLCNGNGRVSSGTIGGDYWTVMVPIIWGWMEQLYL